MGNRFGVRDLILTLLLIAVLVSIWLEMKQNDLHGVVLRKTDATLTEIRSQLNELGDRLEQGVRVSGAARVDERGNGTEGASEGDPFYRLRKAQTQPDYTPGDWLVGVFGVAVGKLTPLISADVYASIIESNVLESLAVRDPDTLEWRPWLAKSWQVSEDGLTIMFELRRNARFSDGGPVTAADVVFTYDWIMNPKVAAPRTRAYFEKIEAVEKLGDDRVLFRLREPYFKGFEICAGLTVLSKKFYSQFTEEQFNEMPGLLFGSGPYKLVVAPQEWRPGSGMIELVRNDRYWGLVPAFDKIVYREVTDETARLTSFTNGDLDEFHCTPEQYLRLKDNQAVRQRANLYEYETLDGGYRYVAWNQKRNGKATQFADKRVRQALTMLIDRKDLCENLMVGLATVSTGPFHRLGKQNSKSVNPWPYDPQRAKALLKKAGFEDRDGDGVIESAGGQPFEFKLIYPASSANYQQMAFALKDSYARAGIVLEPDPLEWTIMIQRINQRDYDAMTLGWTGSVEGDPYQIFHSSQIADGGDNFTSYANPELDGLIDEARRTVDEEKRMGLWHRVHEILHEDQPYSFLFTIKAVTFVDKRVKNIELTTTGLNAPMEWYVPATSQKWGK